MKVENESYPRKMTDSIRITIACKYPFLRDGLGKILEEDKRLEIMAKASNLLDLIESYKEFNSDILLLDVDLLGLNLKKILELLKKNKTTKVILILSDDYDEYSLLAAIRCGVRGYVSQNMDSNQLTKAIQMVSDGELWVERKMMVKVLDSFATLPEGKKGKGGTNTIYNLTETETKIVKLVFTGLANKDIAKDIYLSEKTVKFHLYKIFKKLSVKNRSQLILYGFHKGLIN